MDQDARDGSDAVRNAAAVAPPRAFGIDEHVNRTVVGILEQRRPPVGAARRLIESVEPRPLDARFEYVRIASLLAQKLRSGKRHIGIEVLVLQVGDAPLLRGQCDAAFEHLDVRGAQTVDRVAFGVRLPGQRTAAQVEPHAVAPFEAVFVDAGETQPEAVTAVRAFDIGRAEILAEIHLVPGDIGVELHVLRAVVADDKGFELRTGSQSHRAARSLGPQRREIVGPHACDGGKAEQGGHCRSDRMFHNR